MLLYYAFNSIGKITFYLSYHQSRPEGLEPSTSGFGDLRSTN